MKVMVEGKVYDANDGHVAILLSPTDKINIAKMSDDLNIYSAFPDTMDRNEVSALNKTLRQYGDAIFDCPAGK